MVEIEKCRLSEELNPHQIEADLTAKGANNAKVNLLSKNESCAIQGAIFHVYCEMWVI